MAKSKIGALRLKVFKEEMEKIGYQPSAFKQSSLQKMADDAFKGYKGEQLKSYGAKYVRQNGKLVLEKVKGEIRKRQEEQILSYREIPEFPRTFGQQIADKNIIDFYGFDIFAFIKEQGIENYDISEGSFYDPRTGEKRYFGGKM